MTEVDIEQWKSDGKCDICRRKEYCGKKCKAYERSIRITASDVLCSYVRYLQNRISRNQKEWGEDE